MRAYPLNVPISTTEEAAGASVRYRAESANRDTLPVGRKIQSYSDPTFISDPARLPRARNGGENQPHFDARSAGEVVRIQRAK